MAIKPRNSRFTPWTTLEAELIPNDYCADESLFPHPQNQTRGLMGNWTFDVRDDFTLPNGREGPIFNADTMRDTYDNFARECKVSIFYDELIP